jgi:hypothetical protein
MTNKRSWIYSIVANMWEFSVVRIETEQIVLVQGRWFSPGTPASSTTKTGRHDIAGILLKVVLNTKIQIQILAWLCIIL